MNRPENDLADRQLDAQLRGAFAPPPAVAGAPAGPSPTPAQLAQREKSALVSTGLDRMMQLAKKHGVKVAFGTDVFGAPRV